MQHEPAPCALQVPPSRGCVLRSRTCLHPCSPHEHNARPCIRQVVGLFPFLAVDRASAVQRAAAAGARVPRLMGVLGAAAGRLPERATRWAPRRLAGARRMSPGQYYTVTE